MNKLEAELRKSIKQQDDVIKELEKYIYKLEDELEFAKYQISRLNGELSILYNNVDDSIM